MTLAEKICNLATCPTSMHELKDESIDRGPVPRQPVLSENWYIVRHALVPLAIQQASHYLLPGASAFLLRRFDKDDELTLPHTVSPLRSPQTTSGRSGSPGRSTSPH